MTGAAGDSAGARAMLPYEPSELGGLPEGWRAVVWDGRGPAPADAVLEAVEFFVVPYTRTDAAVPVLGRLPALHVVQSLSAGVENLLPHVPAGVTLCNARGVHDTSTAEHAVTLLLAALRGIPELVRAQEEQRWAAGFRPALADRTVLVLGYGAIGAAVEARLVPFECEVLRVARTARSAPRGPVHALAELPSLLPRADAVVLTLPLTEETRGLVDAGFLAGLGDGAVVVNVGRGAVVDTSALLAELRAGRLVAALDVTDPEPLPPGHALWTAPNTLISPHVAATTSAFRPRALALVRSQLARYAAGEPPENVVSGRG
ncbi:2-hydroxyacid dehydrogenase [Streptomyces triticiradicis]|uniref:2-hydroxyacid dehydrogenase n=1 Tax=Streptomyces triticiradicis TaxID=2651189 RepID=A0A7J5D343_9ACTN|nr:2-hydroxyacid dehydrogenase [Streptomyces triticiradicis]KAB1977976.1 2-hydroxyacid dehydrogenase [Streptomyces triticiradicis]